jgi:probable F420-dependent oxidoreductase
MKFGIFGINSGVCADPDLAIRVAKAAEAAGFESVWTGEHVVLPDPQKPPSPAPPHMPMLDPAVALANLASETTTLKLGTGIIILPQRNPLVLAKELASVDVVSKGRLLFGVGVGYLRAEFDALGVSFDAKGARTSEAIEAIRALWTMEKPAFEGNYFSFSGIQSKPTPVQSPHPPIIVGGHSPGAYRRAVAHGNGWYGFALNWDKSAESIEGLATAAKQVERPSELGPLEIGITPAVPLDRNAVARFADMGVSRLVPFPIARSPDEMLGFVESTASDLIR